MSHFFKRLVSPGVDLTNDLSGSVAGELYKLSQVKRRQVPHGDLVRKCANDGGLARQKAEAGGLCG